MTDERFTCPRREEGPRWDVKDEDQWTTVFTRAGMRACNYCGSLDPQEVLDGVETGVLVLGPTDKNYKAYVETDDGATFEGHPKGQAAGKLYFQHLSDEQRLRFIQLHNDRVMKVGYPGHFYVDPFFCRRESQKLERKKVP